jgi:hypothetical protein
MSWFCRNKGPHDAEGKTQKIINRVESEHAAVRPISKAVLGAALACADAVKPFIQFSNEDDRKDKEVLVRFEFLYFFMHLACRLTFAAKGDAMRTRLQNIMGPVLVRTAVEMICGHWPQNLKDRIQSEVYEKLNEAECEYSSYKGLFSEEMFSQLGRHVASLCGSEMNPVTIHCVVCEAVDAVKESGLKEVVEATGTF